jgi:hypothetical protein
MSGRSGWAIDNAESVWREAACYRGMTPDQKLELVASACRAAAALLQASPNRARALAHEDPLPASSVAALQRLMEARRVGIRARCPGNPAGREHDGVHAAA